MGREQGSDVTAELGWGSLAWVVALGFDDGLPRTCCHSPDDEVDTVKWEEAHFSVSKACFESCFFSPS